MRIRLLAALALTAGVAASGAVAILPTAATADTAGPQIIADLNGDGLLDHATLGPVGTTNKCTVTVQDGLPGGGFGPATVHTYTSAKNTGPFCPNIGTAIKLGNEKRPDLATGFSFGYRDIVVLHKFKPSAVFTGIEQPDFLRTADFNGDGRQDLLEYTNQGSGLATFNGTAAGTLVPGAINVCQTGPSPQYALADFNGDGGQDILLSEICPFSRIPKQAVVLFGNGQASQVLASSADFHVQYTVFVIDLDGNTVPDVGLITTQTGGATTIRYFHNDGIGVFTEVSGPGSGPVAAH
jgi:hypothetical protein